MIRPSQYLLNCFNIEYLTTQKEDRLLPSSHTSRVFEDYDTCLVGGPDGDTSFVRGCTRLAENVQPVTDESPSDGKVPSRSIEHSGLWGR